MKDKLSQVREFLLDGIESGRFPPRSQLPGARDIAAEVGASFLLVQHAVSSLEQDGNILPGASVPHQFQSSSESSPQSFTVLLPVTTAPTTLQVVGEGGSYLANSMALNVTRLGDVPAP